MTGDTVSLTQIAVAIVVGAIGTLLAQFLYPFVGNRWSSPKVGWRSETEYKDALIGGKKESIKFGKVQVYNFGGKPIKDLEIQFDSEPMSLKIKRELFRIRSNWNKLASQEPFVVDQSNGYSIKVQQLGPKELLTFSYQFEGFAFEHAKSVRCSEGVLRNTIKPNEFMTTSDAVLGLIYLYRRLITFAAIAVAIVTLVFWWLT